MSKCSCPLTSRVEKRSPSSRSRTPTGRMVPRHQFTAKLFQGAAKDVRVSLLAAVSSTHGNSMKPARYFPCCDMLWHGDGDLHGDCAAECACVPAGGGSRCSFLMARRLPGRRGCALVGIRHPWVTGLRTMTSAVREFRLYCVLFILDLVPSLIMRPACKLHLRCSSNSFLLTIRSFIDRRDQRDQHLEASSHCT